MLLCVSNSAPLSSEKFPLHFPSRFAFSVFLALAARMEGIIETMSRWKRANEKLRQELRTLKTENTLMSRLFDDLQEQASKVHKLESQSAELDREIAQVQQELHRLDSESVPDDMSASGSLQTWTSEEMEWRKIQAFRQKFLLRCDLRMRC
mmetsp:Transcript_83035/g.199282  ORF Transcript_83035/g.199282 Transcript_83035/m.199282 type:complete len:151 (-) Transcript_83035:111-563(-)